MDATRQTHNHATDPIEGWELSRAKASSEAEAQDSVVPAASQNKKKRNARGGKSEAYEHDEALPSHQGPLFACPFYKADPFKYPRCIRSNYAGISRLKQHLKRVHVIKSPCCPKCHEIFSTHLERDIHIRDISCKLNTNPTPVGVCEDKWCKIKGRMRGSSREMKWRLIWDIIFPGQPSPSCYAATNNEVLSSTSQAHPSKHGKIDFSLPESWALANWIDSPMSLFEPYPGYLPDDLPYDLPCDLVLTRYSEPPSSRRSHSEAPTSLRSPESNDQSVQNGMCRDSTMPPMADPVHPAQAFPDSAYGSGSYHTKCWQTEGGLPQTEPSHEVDAMTSYSDATRISPDRNQQYVQGLANAISKSLGDLLDSSNRSTFFSALPDLLKAFAIRIGHENDTHKNKAIMYFAHRYRDQIVRQVENDFLEPETTNEKPPGHGMSLCEKMHIWNRSPEEQDHSAERELFEGVQDEDEDEDEYTPLDLDSYDEIALRSKAFEWLVSDLRRISSLRGCTSLEDTPIASIQGLMRRGLPTGRLRKTQGPRVHTATFKLGRWPSSPAANIFDSVVVTCFSGEAQATTVRRYMNQTWPSTGRLVLNLLEAVVEVALQKTRSDVLGSLRKSHRYTSRTVLPDETNIEASYQEDTISVTVAGPANTIIECGEQLAWLRSAIAPLDFAAVDRVPLLVDQQHASALSSGSRTFLVHTLTRRTDVNFAQRNMWDKVLGRDVAVIRGFPILRRPHGFSGLELPLDVLLQWTGASAAGIQDGLLQGSNNRALRLVKKSENVLLWREQPASGLHCNCEVSLSEEPLAGKVGRVGIQYGTARHVLCTCECLGEPHQSASGPKLGSFNSTHKADLGASPVKNAPLEPKLPAHNYLAPEDMAVQDAHGMQATQELRPVVIPAESASLAGPVSSTPRSSSSYLGDSATSFDSDMDSTSDYSGTHTLTPLDDNDPMRTVLDIVANHLYSGFRSANGGNGQAQASSSASSSSWTPATSGSGRGHASASASQKRKRADDDDQGSRKSRDLPPSTNDRNLHHGLFACPFWKSNPNKHSRCFKRDVYPRLTDVKQHVRRRHIFRKDPCCQRCWVRFPDEAALQRHVDQIPSNCEHFARDYEDGIGPGQDRQLSKRAPRGSSEEQGWFLMWDIVFPDKRSRPGSAYIDPELSEDANSIFEYFQRHGKRVFREQLTSAGIPHTQSLDTEIEESHLERVLEQMMESVRAEWLSSRRCVGFEDVSRTGPPSTYTPADSGVVLGTQAVAAAPSAEPQWDICEPDMGGLFGLDESGMPNLDEFNFDYLGSQ